MRCTYCDATYTYEEPGSSYSIKALLEFTDSYPDAIVEITGGEPLLQENIYQLMDELLKAGRIVLIETNGSLDISKIPNAVVKIMDIKCPGSGMDRHMNFDNLVHLSKEDEIKFVLTSKKDYDWAISTITQHHLDIDQSHKPKINFSPIQGKLSPKDLAEWILADQIQARLQIQLHKIIWPEITRGK